MGKQKVPAENLVTEDERRELVKQHRQASLPNPAGIFDDEELNEFEPGTPFQEPLGVPPDLPDLEIPEAHEVPVPEDVELDDPAAKRPSEELGEEPKRAKNILDRKNRSSSFLPATEWKGDSLFLNNLSMVEKEEMKLNNYLEQADNVLSMEFDLTFATSSLFGQEDAECRMLRCTLASSVLSIVNSSPMPRRKRLVALSKMRPRGSVSTSRKSRKRLALAEFFVPDGSLCGNPRLLRIRMKL